MARLSLTKASLTKEKTNLKTFHNVLPSLDMKRRQISAERQKARMDLARITQEAADLEPYISEKLPMVANELISLDHLVRIKTVDISEENLMGTWLPRINAIEFDVQGYGFLTKPFWVEPLCEALKQAIEAKVKIQVGQRRVQLLEEAEKTVTQKYNLFDKVLIPRAKQNIRKISIYLADAERAGVVNSKIAKKKKQTASL